MLAHNRVSDTNTSITFLGGLIYSIVNHRRAKRQHTVPSGYEAHRPYQSVPAQHNANTAFAHTVTPPPITNQSYGPSSVAPHTTSYGPTPTGHVELSSQPYHGQGAAADYYSDTAAVKPTHMV
jgi:hypothetical protein